VGVLKFGPAITKPNNNWYKAKDDDWNQQS